MTEYVLFPDGTRVPAPRLIEVKPFRSGVVPARYRPERTGPATRTDF
ncbi:hypothetical protein [Nocardia shimofusensis]|nr:hypothetical protein [Nocardia shimofusensis]